MCIHPLIGFRMCFFIGCFKGGNYMQEFLILEIDFEKGILKTMEGRNFKIEVFDIPTMAGWCPCENVTYTEINGRKILRHYSGVTVRLREQ